MTKKIVLIVLGAILLLCGCGSATFGGLLSRVTGSDNTLQSSTERIGSASPALVSETSHITNSVTGSSFGGVTITLTAQSADSPIFLGVAPAADVERYLGTVAYDEITNLELDPFRVETRAHTGGTTVDAPTNQTFWTKSATGTNPTLEWEVTDGDYRLVMMNADGSPGVVADARFGLKIVGLFGIGIGGLIIGAILALVGIALIIWGIRAKARSRRGPPESARSRRISSLARRSRAVRRPAIRRPAIRHQAPRRPARHHRAARSHRAGHLSRPRREAWQARPSYVAAGSA